MNKLRPTSRGLFDNYFLHYETALLCKRNFTVFSSRTFAQNRLCQIWTKGVELCSKLLCYDGRVYLSTDCLLRLSNQAAEEQSIVDCTVCSAYKCSQRESLYISMVLVLSRLHDVHRQSNSVDIQNSLQEILRQLHLPLYQHPRRITDQSGQEKLFYVCKRLFEQRCHYAIACCWKEFHRSCCSRSAGLFCGLYTKRNVARMRK